MKDEVTILFMEVNRECIGFSEQRFNVGDWVFLRLQPFKQMSLKNTKKDNKLSPKYYGPYKVLQKIGSMDYKIELLAS